MEEVEVNSSDPDFYITKARLYQTHDVVRYVMVLMKFKKIIYHCRIYSQAGITRVVFARQYRLTDGVDLLRRAGVEIVVMPIPEIPEM